MIILIWLLGREVFSRRDNLISYYRERFSDILNATCTFIQAASKYECQFHNTKMD